MRAFENLFQWMRCLQIRMLFLLLHIVLLLSQPFQTYPFVRITGTTRLSATVTQCYFLVMIPAPHTSCTSMLHSLASFKSLSTRNKELSEFILT